ncbi:MAG: carboxypeptidase-like regulatory domain-containing protein, partial [Bacteroidota bacterium]
MHHKYLLFLIILFLTDQSFGQKVNGVVADQLHQPLIGAAILELNTSNGTITDVNGSFELAVSTNNPTLVITYTGYLSDTVPVRAGNPIHIKLAENSQQLDEVLVQSTSTFFDRLDSKHTEIITEAELTKAACCNLSESFETNASVDVSFTDAVTGAKTIRMLGLGGDYVQINRENIPHVRGLSGRYGLGFVPGTWLQSIDV